MADQETSLPPGAKDEFFALSLLRDRDHEGVFLAQVHFCTDQARRPGECQFIVVEDTRGGRPECPRHQRRSMSWANVYALDDTIYRQSH